MRIEFPEATKVHRRIPKEAFYKRLQLSAALKDKFISDVDRIFVENSFTVDSLNFTTEADVKEILFLSVTLKRKDFDKNYLSSIRFICLAMTEKYIKDNFDQIIRHESDIESRFVDTDCSIESLTADNRQYIDGFQRAGERVVLIDHDHKRAMEDILGL